MSKAAHSRASRPEQRLALRLGWPWLRGLPPRETLQRRERKHRPLLASLTLRISLRLWRSIHSPPAEPQRFRPYRIACSFWISKRKNYRRLPLRCRWMRGFFDLVDFFAVDESAAGVASAASDCLDLEVFFAVELSAVAVVSAVSAFLLFVDFLVVEESAAPVSSGVVGFFFLDFAALVSLWSVVAGV